MRLTYALILALRPYQWTKNVLVFSGFIFSGSLFHSPPLRFLEIFIIFLAFCVVSGFVYVLNDLKDLESDRLHPTKSKRPMASGKVPPWLALIFSGILASLGIVFAAWVEPLTAITLIIYLILNWAYSYYLKHVVILDIFIVASGFFFRVLAGTLAIEVDASNWLLICTFFLSLLVATGKRRHEFFHEISSEAKRPVMIHYNQALLDQIISISASASLITYSLYSITSGKLEYAIVTVPVVGYAIIRYLYIIFVQGEGGSPEKNLIKDRHMQAAIISYGILILLIVFLNDPIGKELIESQPWLQQFLSRLS